MTKAEVKKLHQAINDYDQQIAKLKELRRVTTEKIASKEHTIKDLTFQIDSVRDAKTPVVSEHAILRYLERVWGIDMEFVKSMIVPKDVEEVISGMGQAGQFPVHKHPDAPQSHKVKVVNNVIVTVKAKECHEEGSGNGHSSGRGAHRKWSGQ